MPLLRLALAQVNTTVGDLVGNADMVIRRTAEAAGAGAHLVAFPEMTLTGYPPEDLVLRAQFRQASLAALDRLAVDLAAAGLGAIAAVVGYLDDDGGPRNAAAVLHHGAVVARYYKHHLPNYGVFDERRYFVAGTDLAVVRHCGVDVAITICEDLWRDAGPFAVAREAGVGLVVTINGSPYERRKDDQRLPLLRRRAAEAGAPIAYVNAAGAQDELVFDGDSMYVAADGELVMRAPQFREGVHCVDVDLPPAPPDPPVVTGAPLRVRRAATGQDSPAPVTPAAPVLTEPLGDEAEVWGALVTGLRDYVGKNGFSSVVLGQSGGIDSAVVATIATDALGGANVNCVALPSSYSSVHSQSDAAELAQRLGANFRVVPIAPMVEPYVTTLHLSGVAEENVQARVRGTVWMAIANAEGHLALANGNKSELAVGYSTIYGDTAGGFAPIKDVPKTLVWALARWRNAEAVRRGQTPPIPQNSIDKPPSAELRPGQVDSDSLPDYEILDAIVERYVDSDQGVDEIVAAGFDPAVTARVATLIDRAEWKRRQYPPGPKISFKSFGKDRRLPITSRWSSQRPS